MPPPPHPPPPSDVRPLRPPDPRAVAACVASAAGAGLIAILLAGGARAAPAGDPSTTQGPEALLVAGPDRPDADFRTRDARRGPLCWRVVVGDADALLAAGEAVFVAPVEPGRDGGWAAPGPTLLVRAADRRAESARRAVARVAPWAELSAGPTDLPGVVRVDPATPDGREVLALAEVLAALPEVEWAEPDRLIHGARAGVDAHPPDDPLFPEQWALSNADESGGVDLGVLDAWTTTRGAARAGVLVIDVGVDLEHPDLNLGPALDLTDDGGDGGPVNVCDRHGTWVAGCVAAVADNGLGVAGVAPESPVLSARALVADTPLGFCDGNWTTVASWTAEALAWGRRMGARVSVNSNAYGFESEVIAAAYAETRASGMLHLAAAGNAGSASVAWPAALEGVLAVGAVDAGGDAATFSNGGDDLDLVAPGVGVWTTDGVGTAGGDPLSDYLLVDGTSFAAPMAAATAALMLAARPDLPLEELELGLLATARDLGPPGADPAHGHGLVDAARAVAFATGAIDVLLSDPGALSLAAGGVQILELDAADPAAGAGYLVLGSATGTTPGVAFGGVELPLVEDAWFDATLAAPNAGALVGTLGRLGRLGRATAAIRVPAGSDPALAGTVLHHTFVRLTADGRVAEPAVPVALRLEP